MLRHLVLSLITTALRLASASLVFLAFARAWGPGAFGLFMLASTTAALLARPADYGFLTLVTRDLGRAPGAARAHLAPVLTAKLGLSAVVAGLGLLVCLWRPYNLPPVLLALLVADALLLSWFSLFVAALRGLGHFGAETRASAWMYGTTVAGAIAVLVTGAPPAAGAILFVAGRLLGLGAAWRALTAAVSGRLALTADRGRVREVMHSSGAFALHGAASMLATNADTLVIGAVLGPVAVGVYQTGLKLLAAAMAVPDALATVYLPRLAATTQPVAGLVTTPAAPPRDALAPLVVGFARQLAAYGLLAAAAMTAIGPVLPRLLGAQYDPLVPLLPWFGLLLLARTITYPTGAALIVGDRLGVRALGVLAAAMLGTGIQWQAAQVWGVPGAVIGNVVAGVGLAVCYAAVVWQTFGIAPLDRPTALLLALTGALMGLMVAWPHPLGAPVLSAAALVLALRLGVTSTERLALARLAAALRMRCTPHRA